MVVHEHEHVNYFFVIGTTAIMAKKAKGYCKGEESYG